MKFSLAGLRGKNASLEEEQLEKNASNVPSVAWATATIVWAIGINLAAIAWATAIYLIERERQWAQVEVARLELEAKKQIVVN